MTTNDQSVAGKTCAEEVEGYPKGWGHFRPCGKKAWKLGGGRIGLPVPLCRLHHPEAIAERAKKYYPSRTRLEDKAAKYDALKERLLPWMDKVSSYHPNLGYARWMEILVELNQIRSYLWGETAALAGEKEPTP